MVNMPVTAYQPAPRRSLQTLSLELRKCTAHVVRNNDMELGGVQSSLVRHGHKLNANGDCTCKDRAYGISRFPRHLVRLREYYTAGIV